MHYLNSKPIMYLQQSNRCTWRIGDGVPGKLSPFGVRVRIRAARMLKWLVEWFVYECELLGCSAGYMCSASSGNTCTILPDRADGIDHANTHVGLRDRRDNSCVG